MQDNDHTIEADPFARESTESSEVELSPLASLDPRAWPLPSAGRFAMRGPTCNFSEIGVLHVRAHLHNGGSCVHLYCQLTMPIINDTGVRSTLKSA